MVQQTIQIFARVKPTKAKTGLYEADNEHENGSILTFNVPRDGASGFINNKKEDFRFKFQKIFDRNAKQDEIFDDVAKPVIDNVLAGYNGTIFAYGQTGSGKTFTITGGPERYQDRGMIPRSLGYVFQYCKDNPEHVFNVQVSYLEIYNEAGYDLLAKHEASSFQDMPKVFFQESEDQYMNVRNLSTHATSNEEEALNWLFLGDTNRMIAETPMNNASTRSHCIFTIHISSREAGSATIRSSKLHLVDLAGSERVAKTGVDGVLLKEAKSINLSLHYLERVIISLSEKKEHIPYRDSMMTRVLRDSLGGNCMTTMIATCSVEKKNLEESISTCRFSQRVAMVKNDAILNEELDPSLMVARLKRELADLKEELAMATGQQRSDELSDEELERCKEAVQQYLDNNDPEASLNVGADMRKIQQCYRLMKQAVLERGQRVGSPTSSPSTLRENTDDPQTYLQSVEAKKLRELVQQRDNEINILVNMLKNEKKRALDATNKLESMGHKAPPRPASSDRDSRVFTAQNGNGFASQRSQSIGNDLAAKQEWPSPPQQSKKPDEAEEKAKRKILGEMSMGRQEAFESFRRDYAHNSTIEKNKQTMKSRIAEAKKLGEKINVCRTSANNTKKALAHLKMLRQNSEDAEDPELDEQENQLREQIKQQKAVYNDTFQQLRAIKIEIEHLEHLLEKSKLQMLKDFDDWWIKQTAKFQQETPRSQHHQQHHPPPPPPSQTKAAWRTPPVTPQHSVGSLSCASSVSSTSLQSSDSRTLMPLKQASAGGRTSSSGYTSAATTPSSTTAQRRPLSGRKQQQQQQVLGGMQLTGDAEADENIKAFYKARQNVLRHAQQDASR